MKAKFEIITPELATQMLRRTSELFKNRGLKRGVVERYSEDMKIGRWKENGESIILDEMGTVIDGQHRLHAIVRSNKSFGFIVVTGVSRDSFDTIDLGANRSAGDTLGILGYKNTRNLGAIARLVEAYHTFGVQVFTWRRTLDIGASFDVKAALDKHPEIVASSKFTVNNNNCNMIRPAGLIGSLHYIFGRKSICDRDDFFSAVIDMKFNGEGCPVRALHKAHGNAAALNSMELDKSIRAAFWIKAWNAYRTNKQIKLLQFAPEHHEFPEII